MQELTQEKKKELIPDNTILLGYRGSISHGMYVPSTDPNSIDDIDLMGVYMFPVDAYLGLNQPKDVVEKFIGEWDTVSYEYRKFVRLLLKSNPNVMSLLWLLPEFYLDLHPYGRALVDNRNLFVSKLAYNSYIGYAYGQLKKMEVTKCLGYMGKKRKELVERFHFDTKNASHCIRLLKMCIEFLEEGKLNVFRDGDAETLLQIKRGEWKLEEVKDEAERLFSLARETFAKSKLPEEPNYKKVNELVKDILYNYISKGTI